MLGLSEVRGKCLGFAYLILTVVLLLTSSPGHAGRRNALTLEQANARWAGAQCRSLWTVEFNKGKNREGWTKSKWIFRSQKNHETARVWVSDKEAFRRATGNTTLFPGTDLLAVGWAEEEPGGSVFLELQHPESHVRFKVFYLEQWIGKVEEPRLHEFESWVRFSFCEPTSAPSEKLLDAASPSPAPEPAPEPDAHFGTTPLPPPAVELSLLAASAEPPRLSPGEEIRLVAIYSIQGLPPGQQVSVAEKRSILHAGTVLTTLEAMSQREAGTHRSSQALRLPADLAAGIYQLRLSLEAAGAGAQGSAVFEVLDHGSQ